MNWLKLENELLNFFSCCHECIKNLLLKELNFVSYLHTKFTTEFVKQDISVSLPTSFYFY